MDKLCVIQQLKKSHTDYTKLFIMRYPTMGDASPWQDQTLYDLAINTSACAIALGTKALMRLRIIGFDKLYAFDNPVDHFTWRLHVREQQVCQTIYASIIERINAELDRLETILSLGGECGYDDMPENLFLISKDKYTFPAEKYATSYSESEVQDAPLHFDTVTQEKPVDLWIKISTVGANVVTILKTMRSLFIG